MADVYQSKRDRMRRHAVSAAALAFCAGISATAGAFEVDTGNEDLQLRFDNTVRYNLGYRTDGQNPAILGNANADDGDRNFNKHSIVTNRVDVLTELDAVWRKQFGGRMSAASWYDNAYSGSLDNTSLATSNHLVDGAPAFGLAPYTERYYRGPSGELLDAFVFASGQIGSMNGTLRVGRHTINWGEALLGGGAIHGISYSQAPLDQAKGIATPGIEAKELYRPQTQVSGQLQVTPELSLAAQYFLQWDPTRFPEAGTYLGFSDALLLGGESVVVVPGVPGRRAVRIADVRPKNSGDWGVAARWSPEWLDGTGGLYYRNFSDKLPQQATVGVPIPTQYFLMYGSDVDMYGFSLAKQLAGISFGLDLTYRTNMPLVSRGVALAAGASLPTQGQTLGARGDTWHGVLNALGTVPGTTLWSAASWNAEITWNRWSKVTSDPFNVFKGLDTYTAIDRVTKDFVGLAAGFTPTWYQVLPGADLSLPLNGSVGLSGNSAVSSGGNKNNGSYSVGLGLDLYSKYRFDLKYVDYFGDYITNAAGAVSVYNGSTTVLKDRGAVYFTFKTTF
jgi:Protein of unknown function (DUF1302)